MTRRKTALRRGEGCIEVIGFSSFDSPPFHSRFSLHDRLGEQPSCQAGPTTAKIFTIIFTFYFTEKDILFSRTPRLCFTSARAEHIGLLLIASTWLSAR